MNFNLCSPAVLFLVLAGIAIISNMFKEFNIVSLLIQIGGVALWTFFLNYLCKKDHTVVSWILVLLPFVFIILMIFLGVGVLSKLQPQQIQLQQFQEIS